MKYLNEYKIKKIKSDIESVQITDSKTANEYAHKFYFEDIEIYESMFIILLNQRNNTEGFVKISQGGTAGTVVDVKLIAKYAISSICAGVILVHNHPSGNIDPSPADENMTTKTKEALKLFDIRILDHIIITPAKNKYYSFADNGKI